MTSVAKTRVLVTGANGFIGRNLVLRLRETGSFEVLPFLRGDDPALLTELVASADFVVHLAGENRPSDPADFMRNNAELTSRICEAVSAAGRPIPLVFASSAQATEDNDYGRSKLRAEMSAESLSRQTGSPVKVYRFPGVFGKWCKPNYNSVVATFCHNLARGLPIRIDDPGRRINLLYVDDVVETIIEDLTRSWVGFARGEAGPVYATTLGELAASIRAFDESRSSLMIGAVGSGFERALYATYISYLPEDRFSYPVPSYTDPRGSFVEMLKTPDHGQFSFFTMAPGVTRGSHYHHTKTEKFLLVRGTAIMRFRNLANGALVQVSLDASQPHIVDTIPGWVHEIFNPGDQEAVVLLWANEVFDRSRPDTKAEQV